MSQIPNFEATNTKEEMISQMVNTLHIRKKMREAQNAAAVIVMKFPQLKEYNGEMVIYKNDLFFKYIL